MSNLETAKESLDRHENSFTRLGATLSWKNRLSHEDWCRLVGEAWSTCDNIRQYRLDLRRELGTDGPIREMMTPEKNAYYDALPELVICHRGCDSSGTTGASWSLDWDVANSFPFMNRYRVPSPVVVTAKVKRSRILAVKLDRDEAEIITFSARKTEIKPADKKRAESMMRERNKAILETLKRGEL